MAEPPMTEWVVDEQQESFLRTVFDLTVHGPVTIGLEDIDKSASLSIGQNRTEMRLDQDTVDIITMYMDEGVRMPMPLVWQKDRRAKRFVVLDGNHRIAAALVNRGEPTVTALLITSETQIAQWIAVVVNTQHGRSTRDPEYTATSMRLLREQSVPVAQIARMFGVSDDRVRVMTKRDQQSERIRDLIPARRTRVTAHTLDALAGLEDEHVRILGEPFLDAPKTAQAEIVQRMKAAPSSTRDLLAHEIVGELRSAIAERNKVRARESRPASQLQGALQRLVGVVDPTRAYFQSSDKAKATIRSNLDDVMPRLARLSAAIHEPATGVA